MTKAVRAKKQLGQHFLINNIIAESISELIVENVEKKVLEIVNSKFVLSPLINWSQNKITEYFESFNIPKHPLYKKGYLSIGCRNCTVISSDSNDVRSGRWSNTNKTECGIHKN